MSTPFKSIRKLNLLGDLAERYRQALVDGKREAAAAAISEVRQAAADWLRDQTKAIRAEAQRNARAGDSG